MALPMPIILAIAVIGLLLIYCLIATVDVCDYCKSEKEEEEYEAVPDAQVESGVE